MGSFVHVFYMCILFCVFGNAFSTETGKTGVIAIARCRARCLAKVRNFHNFLHELSIGKKKPSRNYYSNFLAEWL